jgi:hypothetical protein
MKRHAIYSPSGLLLGYTNEYVVVIPPATSNTLVLPIYIKESKVAS